MAVSHRRLLLPILMLLLAALACSLTRDDQEKLDEVSQSGTQIVLTQRAPTLTPDPNQAKPMVLSVTVLPAQQVAVGQQVQFQATATHILSVTRFDLVTVSGESIATQTVEAGTEVTATLQWTPDAPGTYTLNIVAYHDDVASDPMSRDVIVIDPNATVAPTATTEPCVITVVQSGTRVRSGPGVSFSAQGSFTVNEQPEVIARGEDNSGQGWFQVRRSNGQEGWISSHPDFVEATGDCASIPRIEN